MAKKKNKVRVEINHPEFQADCILTESKAFTYLKRIKSTFKDNLKVVTTVLTPEKQSKIRLHLRRKTPEVVSKEQRTLNSNEYWRDQELKGLIG